MSVIDEIAAERQRQIEVEGWTPEHDDAYTLDELARAAACYLVPELCEMAVAGVATKLWPWSRQWWKPSNKRRDLVKAAALIVAEIERLDRKEGSQAAATMSADALENGPISSRAEEPPA